VDSESRRAHGVCLAMVREGLFEEKSPELRLHQSKDQREVSSCRGNRKYRGLFFKSFLHLLMCYMLFVSIEVLR
jgi:hypothetical protein